MITRARLLTRHYCFWHVYDHTPRKCFGVFLKGGDDLTSEPQTLETAKAFKHIKQNKHVSVATSTLL